MRLGDDVESMAASAKMQVLERLRAEGKEVNPDDLIAIHMGSFCPDDDPDLPEVGSVITSHLGDLEVVEVGWEWTPVLAMEMRDHGTVDGLAPDEHGVVRREDGLIRVWRMNNTNPMVSWKVWGREV